MSWNHNGARWDERLDRHRVVLHFDAGAGTLTFWSAFPKNAFNHSVVSPRGRGTPETRRHPVNRKPFLPSTKIVLKQQPFKERFLLRDYTSVSHPGRMLESPGEF